MAIDPSPAEQIDAIIVALGDWRGAALAHVRALIHVAHPDIVEEIKWRKPTNPAGVPVWSHTGIICTGESYRDKIKLTFPKGAEIAAHSALLTVGAGVRRAIDLRDGDVLDDAAFIAMIRAAIALNRSR